MIKSILIVIMAALSISCTNAETGPPPKSEYELECETVHNITTRPYRVRRCENKEVVCYISVDSSLQCTMKKETYNEY